MSYFSFKWFQTFLFSSPTRTIQTGKAYARSLRFGVNQDLKTSCTFVDTPARITAWMRCDWRSDLDRRTIVQHPHYYYYSDLEVITEGRHLVRKSRSWLFSSPGLRNELKDRFIWYPKPNDHPAEGTNVVTLHKWRYNWVSFNTQKNWGDGGCACKVTGERCLCKGRAD